MPKDPYTPHGRSCLGADRGSGNVFNGVNLLKFPFSVRGLNPEAAIDPRQVVNW